MARALAAQGYEARAGRGARPAQLHRLARRVRSAPDRAAATGVEDEATTPSSTRRRSAPRARSSPTGTGAGRCSSSRPRAGAPGTARDTGMVGAVDGLLDAGRVKLYCVDSFDAAPGRTVAPARGASAGHGATSRGSSTRWCRSSTHDLGGAAGDRHHRRQPRRLPRRQLRAQARRPVPARDRACRATTTRRPGTAGASAASAYFNNPLDYVAHLGGDHLDWLRSRLSFLLVCGQGSGRTRPARSSRTKRLGRLLGEKGIRHELDLWGHDVPHDWPSWRAQIAHHLPEVLLMTETTHLIGLLLGTEEDWPRAFETLLGRLGPVKDASGTTHRSTSRADHDRAVRPARQAALRPRRRPARLLVLPPARVAEEGRADGRRVPAQQPVHVPVDGEARGLLRDDAARAEGAADRAGPAQEPAGQRALRSTRRPSTTSRSTSRRSPSRSATRCS